MGAASTTAHSNSDHHDDHHHDPPFLKKYVFSCDHKIIGISVRNNGSAIPFYWVLPNDGYALEYCHS